MCECLYNGVLLGFVFSMLWKFAQSESIMTCVDYYPSIGMALKQPHYNGRDKGAISCIHSMNVIFKFASRLCRENSASYSQAICRIDLSLTGWMYWFISADKKSERKPALALTLSVSVSVSLPITFCPSLSLPFNHFSQATFPTAHTKKRNDKLIVDTTIQRWVIYSPLEASWPIRFRFCFCLLNRWVPLLRKTICVTPVLHLIRCGYTSGQWDWFCDRYGKNWLQYTWDECALHIAHKTKLECRRVFVPINRHLIC